MPPLATTRRAALAAGLALLVVFCLGILIGLQPVPQDHQRVAVELSQDVSDVDKAAKMVVAPAARGQRPDSAVDNVKLMRMPKLPSTQSQLWCSRQQEPLLGPTIKRFMDKIPPKSAIVMLGDSTMRSVFDFIARCLVVRDPLKKDGNATQVAFWVRDPARQLLFIYGQNYYGHKPYSDNHNRISHKMKHVFPSFLLEGYSYFALLLNLAALHTLHRFPLDPISSYDLAGWAQLEKFVLEEVTEASAFFPRVLLLSPNSLCPRRFAERNRWQWATSVGSTLSGTLVTKCIAVGEHPRTYKPTNPLGARIRARLHAHKNYTQDLPPSVTLDDLDQYCRHGAGLETGAALLAKRFIAASKSLAGNVHLACVGLIDSFALTNKKCELTDDGVHFYAPTQYIVEGALRWLVTCSQVKL